MIRIVTVLLLALATTSCLASRTTINEPLDATQIDVLVPGKTTAAEVLELFGAPMDVVQLGRKSAYRHDFQNTKQAGLFLLVVALINNDTRQDRLWTFYDENDVLTHFGVTFEGEGAEYALPWEDLHE